MGNVPAARQSARHGHYHGQQHVDYRGGGIYLVEVIPVAATQCHRDVALRTRGHRVVEEQQHRHHTAHHIVKAIVFHPHHLQQDARSVEVDSHLEQHPEIQDDGILGHSFVGSVGLQREYCRVGLISCLYMKTPRSVIYCVEAWRGLACKGMNFMVLRDIFA